MTRDLLEPILLILICAWMCGISIVLWDMRNNKR